jgi:hypothetical protein
VFVFPSGPGTTALLLTVNPDAGLSSSSTLRTPCTSSPSPPTVGRNRTSPSASASTRGGPATDRARHLDRLAAAAARLHRLASGSATADAARAASVAEAFLPDVLGYRAREPASWSPGGATAARSATTCSPPPTRP